MKINNFFVYTVLLIWFSPSFMFAQDEADEGLSTQEVLVVKSYTPSLSDAFKITEGPKIPDSLKAKNKALTYKIMPVDVVSTFEPNKASPLKLKKRFS